MPKDDSRYICYSVILTDSVFEINKNNYPQIFL